MTIKTLTPPSGEPLSLADAKAFVRIGDDLEDTLIAALIASARARIEAVTGLSLMQRTYRLTLEDWPLGVLDKGALRLPRPPAMNLVAVRLTNGEAEDDITASFQLETGAIPRLKPVPMGGWIWPRSIHEHIEIDWQAGYASADDIPADLLHAIKLVVAHEYENRDASDFRAQDRLRDRLLDILAPWRELRI